MNTYRMEIVIQNLFVKAENEAIAEKQYARFFEGENCYYHPTERLEDESCGCAELAEDVYHNTHETYGD